MEVFKIRASSAGKISGIKGLGETGKSYCKQWLKETLYKRRTEIKSKYIDKGNKLEEEGFTLMALQLDLGMVYKNDKFFQDDYFCGTPDLIHNGVVYDNKCSWSLDTFPMFETEIPNLDYFNQLQVYMHLTGCSKASLCYTLIDADWDLVSQAVKYITEPKKIYSTIANMVYTKEWYNDLMCEFTDGFEGNFIEILEADRIKTFDFNYDPQIIEKLQSRVIECREYIDKLIK